MSIRAILWRAHRWIGLLCAVPFLVLAITGLAMLVDHSLGIGSTSRLDSPVRKIDGIDRALAEVIRERPDLKLGMVLPGIDERHSWTASLRGANGTMLAADFDPGSGRLIRFRPAGSTFGETLLAIHNSLALGVTGKVVILTTAIALILLAVSGFTIMRKRWRVLASSPLRGSRPIASLHHWAGLVGMAFLLLWAVTGFFLLGVKSLGDLRSDRPRPTLSAARTAPPPLAPMLAQIARQHPGKEIQGIMPGAGNRPTMVMLLDRQAPPWAKSATVSFDSISGAALPQRPTPTFMKAMIAAKSLHTGLWDGWRLRTLYIVVSLLPLILAATGPWLWLGRRFSTRSKAAGT